MSSRPEGMARFDIGHWAGRFWNRRVGGMLIRNTGVSSSVFVVGLGVLWVLVEYAHMDEVIAAGVGFLVADQLDQTVNPDLPGQRFPVKTERGFHVGGQLDALLAFAIGIKDESFLIDVLQQHHAHRRPPGCVRGCQGGGRRIDRFLVFRLDQPILEHLNRIARRQFVVFVHVITLYVHKRDSIKFDCNFVQTPYQIPVIIFGVDPARVITYAGSPK